MLIILIFSALIHGGVHKGKLIAKLDNSGKLELTLTDHFQTDLELNFAYPDTIMNKCPVFTMSGIFGELGTVNQFLLSSDHFSSNCPTLTNNDKKIFDTAIGFLLGNEVFKLKSLEVDDAKKRGDGDQAEVTIDFEWEEDTNKLTANLIMESQEMETMNIKVVINLRQQMENCNLEVIKMTLAMFGIKSTDLTITKNKSNFDCNLENSMLLQAQCIGDVFGLFFNWRIGDGKKYSLDHDKIMQLLNKCKNGEINLALDVFESSGVKLRMLWLGPVVTIWGLI